MLVAMRILGTKIYEKCGYHDNIWRGVANEELDLHMSRIITVTALSFNSADSNWLQIQMELMAH